MAPRENDRQNNGRKTKMIACTMGKNNIHVQIYENDSKFCYGEDISREDWVDFIAQYKRGASKTLTSEKNIPIGETIKNYEKTTITCDSSKPGIITCTNYFMNYPDITVSENIINRCGDIDDFIIVMEKLLRS
jgi:hypothetical protein